MEKQNHIIKELTTLINKNNSNAYEVCATIWNYIQNQPQDQQQNVFTIFLKDIDYFDVDLTEKHYDYHNVSTEFESIYKLEKQVVRHLIEEAPNDSVFYRKLWDKITDNLLFPSISSQSLFLCFLWMDICIPYFNLGKGLTMEYDEYKKTIDKLKPICKKVNFIFGAPLNQRTQMTSLLLKISEEIKDEIELAVFWSYVLKIDSEMTKQIVTSELIRHTSKRISVQEDEDVL